MSLEPISTIPSPCSATDRNHAETAFSMEAPRFRRFRSVARSTISLLGIIGAFVMILGGCREHKASAEWEESLTQLVGRYPSLANAKDAVAFLAVPALREGGVEAQPLTTQTLRQGFGGKTLAFDLREPQTPKLITSAPSPSVPAIDPPPFVEGEPGCALIYTKTSSSMTVSPNCSAPASFGPWTAVICPCHALSLFVSAVQ